MSDYGFSERRNKKSDKKREKRKHPYKSGGKFRATNVTETNNSSEKVVNKKRRK